MGGWGVVPLLSHDGVCCCWREDVGFFVGFLVRFVVELVVGFNVGKCVLSGYALGLKVRLPTSNNKSRKKSGSDWEQVIGERGIRERVVIGERSNLGASDRGVIKIKNTVRNE